MQKIIKYSLISVALLSQLHADNQYTLDNIEVIASQGTSLNKKDVTDSVIVITKESLKESRITNLADALNKLGGIAMSQNGGAGKNTSIYVRGMDTKRLLVLIDGVRYNNPTAIGAAAEFSQIMLYNVEKIEIIKGAQSGIWGGDASGGVINIVTSKAQKGVHTIANIEYGSFDTKIASLQTSYGTDNYNIAIGGSYFNTDGYSAAEPTKSEATYGKRYDELGLEKDSYDNKSFNAKLGYNFTKNNSIEAAVQTIDSKVNYDSGAGSTNDSTVPNTTLQNRFFTFGFKHKDSFNDLKINYNLSIFNRKTVGTFGTNDYKGSVNELKIDNKLSYMKDSFLRVGASYQKFEQKEITTNTDKDYSAISVFATNYNKLALFDKADTIITQSLRYDKYDEFDNSLTGKIGVKQFVYKDFFISTNVGTGFNAPTLGQLYGQWGANPNLKPEKSLTADFTIGNDNYWITGFYNEVTDLIEYDWTLGYVQTNGKSTFRGVEIGYQDYFIDSIGVNAMYTYLKTKNASEEEFARRPKHQIDINMVYYVTDDFDMGINAQYIGQRYDSANKQGAQTGKYTIANFITNIKANNNITFYAKIDNITDKYYQIVDGYATAGRSLYFGLNASY